jgi:acyl-CoA synthetase (NDP forming)
MRWAPTAPKPVIATWNSFKTDEPGYERLVRSGVAVFRSFTNCFSALSDYAEYQRRRSSFRHRPPISMPGLQVQELLAQPGVLSGERASRLLDVAGITVARERHVVSAAQAREAAEAFGRPVVMKLLSTAFPHKSDVGLVRLGVADGPSAAAAFDDLMATARQLDRGAPIEGVLVQEQVSGGIEMIIGLSRDAAAGTALTIGAGGIYAEILHDVAVRPLPVDEQDVREMIGELKVSALLAGARGAAPTNGDDLVKLALATARLGGEAAERLAELDLNPVIVTPERAVVVDVLAVAS